MGILVNLITSSLFYFIMVGTQFTKPLTPKKQKHSSSSWFTLDCCYTFLLYVLLPEETYRLSMSLSTNSFMLVLYICQQSHLETDNNMPPLLSCKPCSAPHISPSFSMMPLHSFKKSVMLLFYEYWNNCSYALYQKAQ